MMSNFLLKSPDCVLIHIPKTGGSTIRRGLWDSNYEGPAFGTIPETWRDKFKFSFVRHPLERLVSAWADFSQLRGFRGTIDEFLDIVTDESIAYDEHRKSLPERIRHHAIPQTHHFNCLDDADFVGRYEHFVADLNAVLERVGKPASEIPALRATKHGAWTDYLSGSALRRAITFYEFDFMELGYDLP